MTFSNMPSGFIATLPVMERTARMPLQVSRFGTLSALEAAAPDWDAVQDQCPFHHVLMDHRWVKAWWNVFGGGKELHGLVIQQDGQPVGVAPMILSKGLEAWPSRDTQLQLSEDYLNLNTPEWRRFIPVRRVTFPLNVPSHNARAHVLVSDHLSGVCSSILDYWRSRRDWDVIVLDGLPTESGQREAFLEAAEAQGFKTLPHGRVREMYSADISGGMDAYLARRGSHFRKRFKAQMRECQKAGRLELRSFRQSEVRDGLEIMFEIEGASWKAKPDRDARVRLPIDERVRRFFTEAAVAFAANDEAVVHVMSLDGSPAGALLGLSRGEVMLSLVIYMRDDARDNLNAAPLWHSLLSDAMDRGMTQLDTHGLTAYARKWATEAHAYQRLYIFNRHVRAQALWASKALSTRISRRLARLRSEAGSD